MEELCQNSYPKALSPRKLTPALHKIYFIHSFPHFIVSSYFSATCERPLQIQVGLGFPLLRFWGFSVKFTSFPVIFTGFVENWDNRTNFPSMVCEPMRLRRVSPSGLRIRGI